MVRVTEFTRKPKTRVPPEQHEERVRKLRKEHEKMIKGKFEFTDAQGGWIDFCYRFFKGDPIQTIHLEHGEVCELPLGLVKHLNNTIRKIRKDNRVLTSPDDRPEYEIQSRVKFIPLEMY